MESDQVPNHGVPYFLNEVEQIYRPQIEVALHQGDAEKALDLWEAWRWAVDNINLTGGAQDMLDLINDLRAESMDKALRGD